MSARSQVANDFVPTEIWRNPRRVWPPERSLIAVWVLSLGGGTPLVIEYKRTRSQNLVRQGMSHLDWLHERFACVAATLSRHDRRAAQQIGRRTDLVLYACLADDELALTIRSPEDRQAPRGYAWPGVAYNHSCPQMPQTPS